MLLFYYFNAGIGLNISSILSLGEKECEQSNPLFLTNNHTESQIYFLTVIPFSSMDADPICWACIFPNA